MEKNKIMASKEAKEYLMTSSIGYSISNLHDVFRVNNNDLNAVIDDVISFIEIAFDAGAESERKKHKWHTENPTKDGIYLCTVEEYGSITYKVCRWLNEPYLKYDRNWQGHGYTVIKWKEIE